MNNIKIGMIGTGYVGLVSAVCFAEFGFTVNCVDKDIEKLKILNNGQIPIYEPGLEDLVKKNIQVKRLFFTDTLSTVVLESDIIFIAVGTPTCPKERRPDLRYVNEVGKEIAPLLTGENKKIIVLKSTVPVGTCKRFANMIRTFNPEANFEIVSNPEFLREGSAVEDFMLPDRIIVGLENEHSKKMIDKLYASLISKGIPVLYTDLETSELIKYSANCFLATKIAFINELADLCEKVGADIENVALGIGLDKRIGEKYLQAGPGYGGSCFPKDTLALVHEAKKVEAPLSIVETVIEANEKRKFNMVNKIVDACGGSVTGKKLAVLGVAFKANTDDIRDSAALTIIQGLQEQGAEITAYDPVAREKAEKVLSNIHWTNDIYHAFEEKDAIVIATEWDEIKNLNFTKIKARSNSIPIIIDLRNLFEPKMVASQGIHYVSIGRKPECVKEIKEGKAVKVRESIDE